MKNENLECWKGLKNYSITVVNIWLFSTNDCKKIVKQNKEKKKILLGFVVLIS